MIKEDIMYNFYVVDIKDKTVEEINKSFEDVPPIIDVQVIDKTRLLVKRESVLNRSGKYAQVARRLENSVNSSMKGSAG